MKQRVCFMGLFFDIPCLCKANLPNDRERREKELSVTKSVTRICLYRRKDVTLYSEINNETK